MSVRVCTWWTPERDAKALQLRADGLGWRRVAKALGISCGSVRYRFDPKHRAQIVAAADKRHMLKKLTSPKPKFIPWYNLPDEVGGRH